MKNSERGGIQNNLEMYRNLKGTQYTSPVQKKVGRCIVSCLQKLWSLSRLKQCQYLVLTVLMVGSLCLQEKREQKWRLLGYDSSEEETSDNNNDDDVEEVASASSTPASVEVSASAGGQVSLVGDSYKNEQSTYLIKG